MKPRSIDVLLLLAAALLVFLYGLGSGSLSSWDEAIYAQVSREMAQSGNWVDITWGGAPWSDKPPLCFWATALFYRLFGVSEFSARLFSSLCASMTVIVTYLLGIRLFNRRAAVVSALVLLSTYHFVWFGRMGTLDVAFTFFTASSIYLFLVSERKRGLVPVFYLFSAFAFLTKGIGAALIPVIAVAYTAMAGKWRLWFDRYNAAGLCVFFLAAGSWYIPAYLHYGDDFLRGHFIQHLVRRTTGAMDGHASGCLSYVNAVLYKGKPWGAAGLLALPFLTYQTWRKKLLPNYSIIAWAAVTLVAFSAVRTKLHWYIMPVYPAIALLAGWGMEKVLRKASVAAALIGCVASVSYYGAEKGIFELDHNPGAKSLASEVRSLARTGEKVYLYDVNDPGMRFYFWDISEPLRREDLFTGEGIARKGIVVAGGELSMDLRTRGLTVVSEGQGFVVMRAAQP